jgi:hypothetical protein
MNKSFSNQAISFPASNSKHYLILFLLWPFLAFLLALKNYSQKESKKVVYIFLIYYGLTFVVGNIGADAERLALQLRHNADLPFSDFFKIVGGLYATDTSLDIVQPLISFIISRFTDYHGILFAVYAAIFGFFYLKSINLLFTRYIENTGWNALIHMAFFIFLLPITSINGFRMWTATWIFFYGAFHVILYRDARYLLIALSSSLVHFSFLSANVILIIYFLAGNRNFIYLPIVIVSFVLPKLFTPFFNSISIFLGGAFQQRYSMYSSEEYIIGRKMSFEQLSWFMKITYDLVFYYILLAIIFIQLKYGYLMKEKTNKNLLSFMLLFLSFVNFGKEIPSFGERFQIIFVLFGTLYVFLYFLKMPGNNINLLTLAGLFPMLLYTAVVFRQGSDSINAWIIAPVFGLPFFVPALSLADLLFY